MTYLPPLDGTTEAAVTRLDAWLAADRDYSLVEALSAIQEHLREATTVTNALGRASVDCTDEDCTCGHDLPFLGDELDAARKVLGDVLAEAERGGIVAISTAERIRLASA